MNSARKLVSRAVAAVAAGLLSSSALAQARMEAERLVVTYKPGAAAAARAAVAAADGRIVLDLREVRGLAVSLPVGAARALARHAAVEAVEPDPMRRAMRVPGKLRTAAVAGTPQAVPYGIVMVQADQLALNAAGAPKLCIVDSGYDIGHEDLPKTGVDGVNLTRAGAWNTDENSHGTHVAGTVAALGGNGVGVVGVVGSGNLPLHIAKVFDASGSARSSQIVKAVQACADAGSKLISMSLGGGGATRFEQRLYDDMAARGILVIAAAGNDGTAGLSYPAGYASVMSVAAVDPAGAWTDFSQFNADVEIAAPGVAVMSTVPLGSQLGSSVSVGGLPFASLPMEGSPWLSASGPLANFGLGGSVVRGSMTGNVCLIERGTYSFADKVKNCQGSGGVGAIVYNNTAGEFYGTLAGARTAIPSVGVGQADGQALLGLLGQSATVAVGGTADVYAAYSGTSMATPHVSAVAALVWSHFPQCTAAQVRAALTATALDIDVPGRDDRTGAGLVQAKAAFDRLALNCGS